MESGSAISNQLHTSRGRSSARDRASNTVQDRLSQYSLGSQRSARQSSVVDPAFASLPPPTLVRDFAYPVYHPLHYGVEQEISEASTPGSDWNPARRQSDPTKQSNGSGMGWSAGPWGGDGGIYGQPDQEGALAALPSTSFGTGSAEEGATTEPTAGDDEAPLGKSRHRKSKSYAPMATYERRRRSSGKRLSRMSGEGFLSSDPAGRDRLRLSRGYGSDIGVSRKDSHCTSTLPSRSFHHSQDAERQKFETEDEPIPLDIEPHVSHSPARNSMGPEDEELFAGPSLALYPFEPENPNELRLVEGQQIMVSYRHGQGWLVASDLRTGEQGLVPEQYVRLISEMPNYDPNTGQFMELDEDASPTVAREVQDPSHTPSGDPVAQVSGSPANVIPDGGRRSAEMGVPPSQGGGES